MAWLNDITLLSAVFNKHGIALEMLKSFLKNSNYTMHICLLDNSTSAPAPIESSTYLTILDNCNFKHTADYKQPSKNHCSSLMWAFNQINTKYVLLCDNDILFKPMINQWLSKYHNYDCIGQIGYDLVPPDRLFPYCCIINLDFVKSHNIKYFDNDRCMISNGFKDTGSSFYDDMITNKAHILRTNINDVCVHLKGASLHDKDLNAFYSKYNELRG